MSSAFVTGEVSINGNAVGGVAEYNFASVDGEFRPLADGSPDPGFAGILDNDSRAMFSSYDIKSWLTYALFNGLPLATGGLVAYARPVTGGAIRAAAGSQKFTIATGVMVPRRLSAAQGQNAQIDMEVIGFTSDGTTPIAVASSSDAFLAPTQNLAWTLGPAYLNGTLLADLQSIELDYGLTVDVVKADGLIFAKDAGITSRLPVINVQTLSPAIASTILAGGLPATQFDFYLRKVTLGGGGTVAGASTVHIKCAVDVAMVRGLTVGGRRSATGFQVVPYYGGSAAQIVLSVDQALP